MPNHVKHKMTVIGQKADVEKFFETIKNEDDLFDFNKIIPCPEYIKLPEGCDGMPSFITDAAELLMIRSGQDVYDYRGQLKTERQIMDYGHKIEWKDEHYEHLIRCCKAIQECGFSHWHPWQVYRWGTKWGAYSIKRDHNHMSFETAWSTAIPIWYKIAEMFPTISIVIEYADEDYGANCGIIRIIERRVKQEIMNDAEFSYKVWDLSKEEIKEYADS